MTSCGDGNITRKVLIIDLSDFENRKEEIAGQLHYAASEVGFVSFCTSDTPVALASYGHLSQIYTARHGTISHFMTRACLVQVDVSGCSFTSKDMASLRSSLTRHLQPVQTFRSNKVADLLSLTCQLHLVF